MAANLPLRIACCGVALLLGACATTGPNNVEERSKLPSRVAGTNVTVAASSSVDPLPGAVATVLGWSGLRVATADISGALAGQATPSSVAKVARRHGRLPYPLDNWDEILGELAAQHPVLVVSPEGEGVARGWVLVGYDLSKDRVYLPSAGGTVQERRLAEMQAAWNSTGGWAMVVLPPGELPATVEKEEYISAAAGLERDGPAWEAVLALDAALALWNDSVDVLLGLGKSLLALGDRKGAAEAFANASRLTDDPAVARWQWAVLQAGLSEDEGRPQGKPEM